MHFPDEKSSTGGEGQLFWTRQRNSGCSLKAKPAHWVLFLVVVGIFTIWLTRKLMEYFQASLFYPCILNMPACSKHWGGERAPRGTSEKVAQISSRAQRRIIFKEQSSTPTLLQARGSQYHCCARAARGHNGG